MQRAILLQTDATALKISRLRQFNIESIDAFNQLLPQRDDCTTFMKFHHKTFSDCKKNTHFNVQIICSIIRDAWRRNCDSVKKLTVKFNIPRNCKTFRTKRRFFVELGIYPRDRIAVPIRENRNYQRFNSLITEGWTCKTFGLTSDLQIVAYLTKDKVIEPRPNMLGIDINAKHFAVSVVNPNGKVLYQTYFGKHIWVKRKHIMARRAILQFHNADRKLARLKHYEADFVKTNLSQIVKEIIKIANRFNADIAIEKLNRFKPKGKRFNRTVMRIPFYKFKLILAQRCFDNNITLKEVDSWHTSKWCSHCGAVGKGHSSNYSLFKCIKCKQIVNADRKASLAVTVKSLLERKHISNPDTNCIQISNRRVPVNGLLHSYDTDLVHAVHNNQLCSGKPTSFRGG